jgi:hypothetical protein
MQLGKVVQVQNVVDIEDIAFAPQVEVQTVENVQLAAASK